MFNNYDSKTNGELLFFNSIKNNINVVFDIGCRNDTEFLNFKGEVHYFDPVKKFIDDLSVQPNLNSKKFFNNFGLSNENNKINYYPKYQSFFDRTESCGASDSENKIILEVKPAKDYILENKLMDIDFIKIDTEGYELNVILGFEEQIRNVKIIQFEYGGTFLDNKVKLIDVVKYLESNDFSYFSYLTGNGIVPITDYTDHYQYCNIVCFNKKYLTIISK